MPVSIHLFNVGCGKMSLIHMPDGTTIMRDCNITDSNEDAVMAHLKTAMGSKRKINVFLNSHRDADHMRGIEKVHKTYPISQIRDAGVEGTTTDSSEYRTYMSLRRAVGFKETAAQTRILYGAANLRFMNSKNDDLSDANDQSIVMKIEYAGSSVMFAGDTSYLPWRDFILEKYDSDDLKSNILLAAHHGSASFFDDPSDEKYYFLDHIKKIKPSMTLVSVGHNAWGLPDREAMRLYDKHSTGSNKGNKVYTTEEKGNMLITLKDDGGWSLSTNQ